MTNPDEKLLILESDQTEASGISRHFGELGYAVESYPDAAACFAYPNLSPPSLVIADVDLGGLKALMRQFAKAPFPPAIIVHTKVINSDHLLGLLRGGAADVIPKPLADIRILEEVVQRQCEKSYLYQENLRYRQELERANRELRSGLEVLRADQQAGRQVQMKMLPENNVSLNRLHCHYLIQPSLYLSGDFFDFFYLSGSRVLFYFADVSGHGASSAFVTVLLKNLSNRLRRNYQRGSSDDLSNPADFVSRVNHELLETKIGKHLTLFVAIIDTKNYELTYSIGAHYPLPILTQDGQSQYLEGKGPPVGILPKAKYPVFHKKLQPGFSLVTCSDGLLEIIEARDLAQKEAALLETIAQAGHTIPALEKAFGLGRSPDLPDDVAIVSISEILD